MLTPFGHLTYCTNIHAGETWSDHFNALKDHFPAIKKALSPERPMGIGLRLSNAASVEVLEDDHLETFKKWLQKEQAYVFTMNGFPYGGFHHERVKDHVHSPDWTTEERVRYTLRLFDVFNSIIPVNGEGGISTSPLSYKPWFTTNQSREKAMNVATSNIIRVIGRLIEIHNNDGKIFHLDLEPEPDGLIESGAEFIDWFDKVLLPAATPAISKKFGVDPERADILIKQHLRLCYDVCHFAVGFEDHGEMIERLTSSGIKVGKIQISAALKANLESGEAEIEAIKKNFEKYDEPVYLHQVVARSEDGQLTRFPDLPFALQEKSGETFQEWRAHFHVPVFAENFGLLQSTRDEIQSVLELQQAAPFTHHLEVETYTWEVLPPELKLPLTESIVRELLWTRDLFEKK